MLVSDSLLGNPPGEYVVSTALFFAQRRRAYAYFGTWHPLRSRLSRNKDRLDRPWLMCNPYCEIVIGAMSTLLLICMRFTTTMYYVLEFTLLARFVIT